MRRVRGGAGLGGATLVRLLLRMMPSCRSTGRGDHPVRATTADDIRTALSGGRRLARGGEGAAGGATSRRRVRGVRCAGLRSATVPRLPLRILPNCRSTGRGDHTVRATAGDLRAAPSGARPASGARGGRAGVEAKGGGGQRRGATGRINNNARVQKCSALPY